VAGLIQYANDHFDAAKAAQARGDFVTYGQELQKVQAALDALNALTGGSLAPSTPPATPVPVPSPSPSP
ncbi:MAG: hypothetical protein ACHQ15_05120, partial [Candidatus Limnocylindrales bacterium]